MASMRKTAISFEVNEEEYEDYEEVEMVEDVEGEDYEEAFEEEEEEEEIEQNEEEKEIEQNGEEEEEEIEQIKEEEEEIEQNGEEEEEIEQNKEEEEEIEPNEEEEEEEEEEEIEQNEDEEEEEEIEKKDEEEEEIKQNNKEVEIERNEEEEEDEKKAVKVLKVKEEEQSVEDPVRKEVKSAKPEKPSESEGKALPWRMAFPPFLQSVSDLEKLHCALSKFLYQWNCLNQSLDSIVAAIDAHAPAQHDVRSPEQEKDELSEQEKEKDDRSEQDKEKDERSEQEKDERSEQEKEKEKGKRSWEILCEQMQGKALRKYIECNFHAIDRLRHEVPEALRRFPDPEELVFKAIGEFCTEGSRASNSSPPLVLACRASILLLEFFVLSGRPTVADSSVKQKAKFGALSWLKRLVKENIESATAVDSLGLILYLACFGIPKEFGSKDLWLLLLKSNLKINIDVFLRSSILVERIPGVIKDLIRGEMYLEAAELSCYFGLTDTFPPLPLLSSCVAKVFRTEFLERQKYRDMPKSKNEAYIRELKSLRSVVQCLKDHNFVVRKIGPINLTKRISKLERIIEKAEMRLKNNILKRKADHKANKKSVSQSKKSVPATSEAAQRAPSHMIQDKPEPGFPSQPLFPDSKVENNILLAEVSNTRHYPNLWERKYHDSSTGYRSLAMEYSSAQHFNQPQASVYGNSGGITGRNLYQFADTAIQEEAQLAKSNRCSNTSPSGSKFGHY